MGGLVKASVKGYQRPLLQPSAPREKYFEEQTASEMIRLTCRTDA